MDNLWYSFSPALFLNKHIDRFFLSKNKNMQPSTIEMICVQIHKARRYEHTGDTAKGAEKIDLGQIEASRKKKIKKIVI